MRSADGRFESDDPLTFRPSPIPGRGSSAQMTDVLPRSALPKSSVHRSSQRRQTSSRIRHGARPTARPTGFASHGHTTGADPLDLFAGFTAVDEFPGFAEIRPTTASGAHAGSTAQASPAGQRADRVRSGRVLSHSPQQAARTGPMKKQSSPSKRPYRSVMLALMVVAGFAALGVRTASLQVRSSTTTSGVGGAKGNLDRRILAAERGDLVDRTGVPLAVNERVANVILDPQETRTLRVKSDPADVKKLNAKIVALTLQLGMDSATMESFIARAGRYAMLARKVDDAAAQRIAAIGLSTVALQDQPERVYPAGDLARGVIGGVGDTTHTEDNGTSWAGLAGKNGLEQELDSRLEGKPGELLVELAPGGREIPTGGRRLVPSTRGTSFELTLDRALQFRVDELLTARIIQTGARRGTVLVMETGTGDVLASSSMVARADGTVVPTSYNAPLIDAYEPGSVMKPFTMAIALERKVMTATETMSVQDRYTMVFKNYTKTFKDDENHATMLWNMTDILRNSSNVGTIRVATKLGRDVVYENFVNFGFGKRTGLISPDKESRGILPTPDTWSGVDIATKPIGQGVSVTAMQLLGAVNTLAADGQYIAPRLVRAEIDSQGTRHDRAVPRPRRVVTSETAATMRTMMSDVVKSGTGMPAAVKGYDIAGKTGTAQKPGKGGYIDGEYMASFVGFFPAAHPRLTIVVILDNPTPIYGSATSAPLFGEIARYAAQRYRIAPLRGDSIAFPAPSVTALESPELKAARNAVNASGISLTGATTPSATATSVAGARPASARVRRRTRTTVADGSALAPQSQDAPDSAATQSARSAPRAVAPPSATGNTAARSTAAERTTAAATVAVRAPAVTAASE